MVSVYSIIFAVKFFIMKTLEKLSLNNEKVLIRVDFNVPLNEEGKVSFQSKFL